MTIKNFKVGQGLDLDGLVLTNGNGELLVNGNAIAVDLTGYATETYVANAIANSTVDLAPAAGVGISYNTNTSQFDIDTAELALASTYLSDGFGYNYNGQGISTLDIDISALESRLTSDGFFAGNVQAVADVSFNNKIQQSLGEGLTWNTFNNTFNVDLVAMGDVSTYLNWSYAYNMYGQGVSTLDLDISALENRLTSDGFATQSYVANAISNLVDSAPATLDTLNELAAALQDNPNVITSLQDIASGKQDALIAGFGIGIANNIVSVTSADVANAIAGTNITYSNGKIGLSDTVTISSVELTDANAFVTAASDVFGNGSAGGAYLMGNTLAVGSIGLTAEVADVFITLKVDDGITVSSRTSKLTAVFTGGEAPTWTEYGIITSGWTFPTTISFNSNREILVEVVGGSSYSAKGVFTLLK